MVASIARGVSAGYYLGVQSEYYTGTREPRVRWYAPAYEFGLRDSAEVDDELFASLHTGQLLDGTLLVQNAGLNGAGRVGLYDYTLSAPKSVSLAWAFADNKHRADLAGAQDRAVRAALALVSRHAAYSRRGHGGSRLERVSLSGAIFQHGEARPVEREDGSYSSDPQLHSHCVLFNCARRADGSYGALDGRHLFKWKMAVGATYHAHLAWELQHLGYAIEATGKNGQFELRDVGADFREAFSARRLEIEEKLADRGLTTEEAPALAAEVTRSGRNTKKLGVDPDQRHVEWAQRATDHGFDPQAILRLRREPVLGQAIAPPTLVDSVLAELTENESVFEARDLHRVLASAAVSLGSSRIDLESLAESALAHAKVIELKPDTQGNRRFTTQEMIRLERGLTILARQAKSRSFAVGADCNIERAILDVGLSDEQASVARAMCGNRSIGIFEGAAGSGKSTTLRAITQAYQIAGCRVIGSATAWKIANQLAVDCGIEARATDAWTSSGAFLDGRTLLVVDEAGQLSTRQMHGLLSEVRSAGAKVIFCGDRKQLQAIGAGPGLEIVAQEVGTHTVSTIVRQRHAWQRKAVTQLSNGETEAALKSYRDHGCVRLCNGPKEAIRSVAERALAAGPSTLIVARTNAEVQALSKEIRGLLKRKGMLGEHDIRVKSVSRTRGVGELPLAVGDRIRFL